MRLGSAFGVCDLGLRVMWWGAWAARGGWARFACLGEGVARQQAEGRRSGVYVQQQAASGVMPEGMLGSGAALQGCERTQWPSSGRHNQTELFEALTHPR